MPNWMNGILKKSAFAKLTRISRLKVSVSRGNSKRSCA